MILTFNVYAFKFMDVEISGNVEIVADKLAEKGFTRKTETIQEGPDKGLKAIVKTEDILLLEGQYLGNDALLVLRTPKKDEMVSGIYLNVVKQDPIELLEAWGEISDSLIEKDGLPDFDFDWRKHPEMKSEVLLLKRWEFKDVVISISVFENKNEILLTISQI